MTDKEYRQMDLALDLIWNLADQMMWLCLKAGSPSQTGEAYAAMQAAERLKAFIRDVRESDE